MNSRAKAVTVLATLVILALIGFVGYWLFRAAGLAVESLLPSVGASVLLACATGIVCAIIVARGLSRRPQPASALERAHLYPPSCDEMRDDATGDDGAPARNRTWDRQIRNLVTHSVSDDTAQGSEAGSASDSTSDSSQVQNGPRPQGPRRSRHSPVRLGEDKCRTTSHFHRFRIPIGICLTMQSH